jgi:hypothetical protein
MRTPRRIHLWSIGNPVIVVPAETGVLYCNQVGGVACLQRELEGFVVPLPRLDAQIFAPEWWERNFNRRLPGKDDAEWDELCRRMEAALGAVEAEGEGPRHIRVLPDPDSCEAWVHVAFELTDPGAAGHEPATTPLRGVLTWQNCD